MTPAKRWRNPDDAERPYFLTRAHGEGWPGTTSQKDRRTSVWLAARPQNSSKVYYLLTRLLGTVPRTKVTRNRQVTIPAEIATVAHISEGDILDVELTGGRVVFQKVKDELPVIKIGRKVGDEEIERLIAKAAAEISG